MYLFNKQFLLSTIVVSAQHDVKVVGILEHSGRLGICLMAEVTGAN